MQKNYLLTLLSFLSFSISLAQNKVVNVNPLTGSVNATIPVYNISRGGVSLPISLVYASNGIKPRDVEGSAGIGWNLQAGGQVSRQLRGLPDDCLKDISNANRIGWLYNNNGTASATFQLQMIITPQPVLMKLLISTISTVISMTCQIRNLIFFQFRLPAYLVVLY
jgi:hypothetical protein